VSVWQYITLLYYFFNDNPDLPGFIPTGQLSSQGRHTSKTLYKSNGMLAAVMK
jgi:hypothetical protein